MESDRLGLLDLKPQTDLRRRCRPRLAVGLLLLLLLGLLASALRSQPPALEIPGYSGPASSAMGQVYYSHYLSRLQPASSHDQAAASKLLACMKAFSEGAPQLFKVRKGDAETVAALIDFTQLYLEYLGEPRDSQLKQHFWPNLLSLSKLQPSDLADELVTDKDLAAVSQEVASFWRTAQRAAAHETIWTKAARFFRRRSAYQTALAQLQADLQASQQTLPQLFEAIEQLAALAQAEPSQDLRPTELHFKLFTSKFPLAAAAVGATPAQKCMRLLDAVRLLLPMSAEDQLFYRLLQGWLYSWSNYRYLSQASAAAVSSRVRSEAGQYPGWRTLASSIWSA